MISDDFRAVLLPARIRPHIEGIAREQDREPSQQLRRLVDEALTPGNHGHSRITLTAGTAPNRAGGLPKPNK
jgi:hypothetical protein